MKFNFDIINLDCASCSVKIERAISSFAEIKFCNLDFIGKKLIIETTRDFSDQEIINFLEKTIHIYEKDVTLQIAGSEEKKIKSDKKIKSEHIKFVLLGISVLLFVFLSIFNLNEYLELAFYIVAYLLVAYEVILKTFHNIKHLDFFDENFLMTIASIGAFAIGQFGEGVMVMILYTIGESFQNFAVEKSKKDIKSLIDLKSELATIILNGEEHTIKPEKLKIGDVIVIKPGEKVPVDCMILTGESKLDTSMLTGETKYRKVSVSDNILSGCINISSVIVAKVKRTYENSTISKILSTIESSSSKKAKSEKFITKFARFYTPIVIILAIFVAFVPPIFLGNLSDWIYKALIFLVISCPCALVISVPLTYFCGVGVCSRKGVLVKGTCYLESLSEIDTICFDKTGTLTLGKFEVSDIILEDGVNKDFFIKFLCYAESGSNHPLAKCVMKLYPNKIFNSKISSIKEVSGKGIEAVIEGREVVTGSYEFLKEHNIDCKKVESLGSKIYVAVENKFLGLVVIDDVLRPNIKKVLATSRSLGVKDFAILTGDNEVSSKNIAEKVGIKKYYSELLPQDKVEKIEEIMKSSSGTIVYVGDGINDAPILTRSDVGVAMGKFGSDIAVESADVVLMEDNLDKLNDAIKIAKRTSLISFENVVFSLLIKLVIMALSILGILNMWWAVFADVGVMVLAILNGLRLLIIYRNKKTKIERKKHRLKKRKM